MPLEREDLAFEEILKHVDRESEHFVVRLATHHTLDQSSRRRLSPLMVRRHGITIESAEIIV